MSLGLFIDSQFFFSPTWKTCWDKVRLQNLTHAFLCLYIVLLYGGLKYLRMIKKKKGYRTIEDE